MLSLESMQHRIVGHRERRSLNTTSFPPDLRCLAYIMLFNLYLVKKLSTINNARAIFLIELHENTYIDISAQLYNIIAKSIGPMPPTPPINSQTILRSKIQIPGDEHAEEAEKAPLADTEIEVEGR